MTVVRKLIILSALTAALAASTALADGTYIYKGATGTVVSASTPQTFAGDPNPHVTVIGIGTGTAGGDAPIGGVGEVPIGFP